MKYQLLQPQIPTCQQEEFKQTKHAPNWLTATNSSRTKAIKLPLDTTLFLLHEMFHQLSEQKHEL